MTTVQRVVQILGIVFLLAAIAGFIAPNGMQMHADPPAMALGIFPVNMLHNIVHLLFGIWGLMAARSVAGAVSFARISGIIYLVLTILAFVDPTTFGLVPIGGNDIWLHAALALVFLYFGFVDKSSRVPASAA